MVSRVYVEKKPAFDVEAKQLLAELRDTLGIDALTALRVINRYDVEGIDEELFARCVPTVFSEPQVDFAYDELPADDAATVFAVEALPGQFHYGLDAVCEAVSDCLAAGVTHCILFGLPREKDAVGSSA